MNMNMVFILLVIGGVYMYTQAQTLSDAEWDQAFMKDVFPEDYLF
jgi:hypothetical protein